MAKLLYLPGDAVPVQMATWKPTEGFENDHEVGDFEIASKLLAFKLFGRLRVICLGRYVVNIRDARNMTMIGRGTWYFPKPWAFPIFVRFIVWNWTE